MKIALYIVLAIVFIACAVYVYMYYPQQLMPIGEAIDVHTIDLDKYHNDCLHPCIRYDVKSRKYYMAQSPYYAWNNKVENPMFYVSEDYKVWNNGILIADTPEKGYNSDPNICICENGDMIYLWRECGTPLCDSLGCTRATVGGTLKSDGTLAEKHVYCINDSDIEDTEQCPIMIEHNGEKYIYAAWYQFEPVRRNKGIAIWKQDAQSAKGGGHMSEYSFVGKLPFESCATVDRCAQVRLFNHIFYCPKPLYHDMWHFDLFEHHDKLYMVSVAEKGDNMILSVSKDWIHFRTFRKPLVNNHYTENYCGYRQYYYKPTAFVKDDTLHVFYTANAKDDPNRNQLYHTAAPAKQVLK